MPGVSQIEHTVTQLMIVANFVVDMRRYPHIKLAFDGLDGHLDAFVKQTILHTKKMAEHPH